MFLENSVASSESGLQRFRGAFGASLLSHAALVWIVYGLLTLHVPGSPLTADIPHPLAGLIWIPTPGESHGGGGGGDQSKTPPRRLQTVGMDTMAVPILKAPPLTPPDQLTDNHQPPPMALLLNVKPMEAGQIPQAGVIQNASLSPEASQGSGRNGGAGTGDRGGIGPGSGPGEGPGFDGGNGGKVYDVGGSVLSPILLREVRPQYTADAMRIRIAGEVLLAGVVLPDGSVTRVRVLRSLDPTYGLDQEAIKAVRQWKFKPGTRFGQPVATEIAISVGFSMR